MRCPVIDRPAEFGDRLGVWRAIGNDSHRTKMKRSQSVNVSHGASIRNIPSLDHNDITIGDCLNNAALSILSCRELETRSSRNAT